MCIRNVYPPLFDSSFKRKVWSCTSHLPLSLLFFVTFFFFALHPSSPASFPAESSCISYPLTSFQLFDSKITFRWIYRRAGIARKWKSHTEGMISKCTLGKITLIAESMSPERGTFFDTTTLKCEKCEDVLVWKRYFLRIKWECSKRYEIEAL